MKFPLLWPGLLLALFLQSLPASAQYAGPDPSLPDSLYLSLEEAVELAIANNPDLERVRMGADLLEKQVQVAKSAGYPQVNASAGFNDNFALPQQLLPGEVFGQSGQIPVTFGVRYGLNAGVEVNQLLYSRSYQTNLRKLDASRATVSLQYLSTMEDLVYNVAQLYIQYQINLEQKAILKANLDQVNTLVSVARAQYENGIVKRLDVDQIKVNQTNLQTELANLETGLEQQLNVLRFYLALDMRQPLVLTERLDQSTDLPLSDTLIMDANLTYQLLRKQLELNELDNEVIKAALYPTVSAFARYNYNGQGDELNFRSSNYNDFTSGLWGINISIPIFDGLKTRRQVEANQIEHRQLQLDMQQFQNATRMEFSNAASKIELNQQLVQTQAANMELAQDVYDVTKLSYQEGVAPLTELINAETSLRQAQAQYLTALINYKLAQLEYVKASGQLAQRINSKQ